MNNKCKDCKFYIFSVTLGSLDKEIWHCRFGFTPTKDCQKMGEYNSVNGKTGNKQSII